MNKITEGTAIESGAAQIGSLAAGLDAQFELSELLRSLDATPCGLQVTRVSLG